MTSSEDNLQIRKDLFGRVRRAVVKIGSGVLTRDDGLNTRVIKRLAGEVSALVDEGHEVILVSSGAVASGMKKMDMTVRPADIPHKQAVAAIGQPRLMLEYEKSFSHYQKKAAQILLTRDDLSNRRRYLNARNTINVLLEWGIIPVINENDTVVVDEIKFGDNDNLSAMMANLVEANLVVNLTNIDGFFDDDPRKNRNACLISTVEKVTSKIEIKASSVPDCLGRGCMESKIKALSKYLALKWRLALCFLSIQKKQRICSRDLAHLWIHTSIPTKRNITVR